MPGKRITPEQKQLYWEARGNGKSIRDSAVAASIAKATAEGLEKLRKQSTIPTDEAGRAQARPDPLLRTEICDEARRALEDFGYFQRRYFGRIPYYWQVEAAEKARELLESPHKEYLVVNCPPGVGGCLFFFFAFAFGGCLE